MVKKQMVEREDFIKYVCGGCEAELNKDALDDEDWRYCPHCGTKLIK
jgi:DNA-directed RNA polymerase subunit RPC12/RpoP